MLEFKAVKKLTRTTGEWVYGLPVYNVERTIIDLMDTKENKYEPIFPETLCAPTGKIDKKGKAVYQGDVIQFVHEVGNKKVKEEVTVFYSKESASFLLGREELLLPFGMFDLSKGEIVGNVHEDKFLREKKKK